MRVTRTFTFEAAHRLPFHDGKCARLHGHHYEVHVTVHGSVQMTTATNPESGMVSDFGRLDDTLAPLFKLWDHRTILWNQDPLLKVLDDGGFADSAVAVEWLPTAENIATAIAQVVEDDRGLPHCHSVEVYETPKGCATWGS